jgi:hypothetical protein
MEGFKLKKLQTLDLDLTALIGGCIGCTRNWVAQAKIIPEYFLLAKKTSMAESLQKQIEDPTENFAQSPVQQSPRTHGRQPSGAGPTPLYAVTSASPSPGDLRRRWQPPIWLHPSPSSREQALPAAAPPQFVRAATRRSPKLPRAQI